MTILRVIFRFLRRHLSQKITSSKMERGVPSEEDAEEKQPLVAPPQKGPAHYIPFPKR